MKLFSGSVFYGREKIEFGCCHVDRKTLEIAVHPDQSVVVKAPRGVECDEVKRRVAKHAGWIIRQRNFFRQFDPRTPGRSYIGGETHLYLGKRYRLKIRPSNHDDVKLAKGYFEIRIKNSTSSEKVKSLLDTWYARRAAAKFSERFDFCWSSFKKLKYPQPKMRIRRLKKRWGSLSAGGTLTLNTDLIRAPGECIDYVITHELCHLQCKGHGPKFYKSLNKWLPDWKIRKHRLESILS